MSEGVQILSVFGHFCFTKTMQTLHYQAINFNGINFGT
jgi:hypothetical protein